MTKYNKKKRHLILYFLFYGSKNLHGPHFLLLSINDQLKTPPSSGYDEMTSAILRAIQHTKGATTIQPQKSELGPPALILGPNPTIQFGRTPIVVNENPA